MSKFVNIYELYIDSFALDKSFFVLVSKVILTSFQSMCILKSVNVIWKLVTCDTKHLTARTI